MKNAMRVAAMLLISATFSAASACNGSYQEFSGGPAARDGRSRAVAALIVMPDAREVSRSNLYDGQVLYQLMEEYPAPKSLEFLRSTLAKEGFQPLDMLILNPGIPSSHVRGWTNAEIRGQRVYAWSAEWEDSEGNVVSYGSVVQCALDRPEPCGTASCARRSESRPVRRSESRPPEGGSFYVVLT